MEELDEVSIDPDHPEHKVYIGSRLSDDIRNQLVDPNHQPVKQKRRKFAPERNKVINDEIQKLVDIGSVREVKYPDWLANVVVVKKKNGKWRVCIDFTDLNKACPKDSFPLPHIDMLVDATAGHDLLSFMDAYSGYNQILMHPDDQEKTAFVTERGTFYYKVMSFGLKNTGATYQRLVNKMFTKMFGTTMEVYIDVMLVAQQHIDHLRQLFDVLDKYGLKLNPTKCSFGVSSGKFLGYLVTHRGVEANPNQIRSIERIESPRCIKDVQKLTGHVAALNRFISKSSERCLPFFNTLRKNKAFEWNDNCEKVLQDLKTYLKSPPLLSKPKDNETLFVYLAVSDTAVSAILVREEENNQHPVYYVSKTLLDAETRYSRLEKLALALVVTTRKLRPYFQCHSIKVLTTYPLKNILHKPELSGRLTKWAVELNEHDISFHPRSAMKSQVLADFIADFTPCENLKAEKELVALTDDTIVGKWTLSVDGSSNIKGSGLGLVLKSPQGDIMEQSIHCGFCATNNEAEYEALIAGLDLAKSLNVRSIKVLNDSQLVVRQLNGTYEARDRRMSAYLNKVKHLQSTFDEFSIEQIPRAENTRADALASLGSTTTNNSKSVLIVHLISPSIQESEILAPVDNGRSWIDPIVNYLQVDILPDNRVEVRKSKQNQPNSASYMNVGIIPAPVAYRTEQSQLGKLPAAPRGFVYMLVLTDYFTKWVEVGTYQQIRDIEVRNFVWKHIICRFGVPREIMTDNGSQFISYDFNNFCNKYAIKLSFSTLRTTPRRSTGETPFSLAYGSEAVIPIETRLSTTRSENPDNEQNNLELSFELDYLDEKRECAALRIQSYQQQVARHYDKKVRTRIFKLHDWVLRRVFQNTKEEGAGKLGPIWEGPYQITDVIGRGAYKLRGLDGRELHNSWNALHLKQYHF
ncbi:hypothetical protein QYF36_012250 [Acer negundo]|nr:hypothetical protein QYF36_012250 [Acer negundo]